MFNGRLPKKREGIKKVGNMSKWEKCTQKNFFAQNHFLEPINQMKTKFLFFEQEAFYEWEN